MNNLIQVKNYASENLDAQENAKTEKKFNKVFHIAKPILVFIAGFFIVPKKVRIIIANLVEVLDAIFPDDEISSPSV